MGKQQQQGQGQGRSRYGSERLLYPVVSSGAGADQLADLEEEDVWSVLDYSSNNSRLLQPEQEHRRGMAGGLSLAFEASAGTPAAQRLQQNHQHKQNLAGGAASSAPLKVPADQWLAGRSSFPISSTCREEEEAAAGEWVAPHEYLQARRGSSSVFQGVGRTLKGRDLSRVRDAVWSNTGFLG